MDFDDLDYDDTLDNEEAPLPEESGNRTFLIIAGVLGGIALLALICIAVFALTQFSNGNGGDSAAATLNAQNTEVARVIEMTSTAAVEAATGTAIAAATATPTETPIPPTDTPTATPTPVIAQETTAAPTANASTQTVAALLTEAAATQTALPVGSITPSITPTSSMPDTGFADDVGLPTMFGAAVLLLVVIFLARRMRTA